MRILVTGASGLLGLNLALEASHGGAPGPAGAGGHTVYGAVHRHPLATRSFTVIETDLLAPGELEGLLDRIQPEWIINCAALAIIDACEADPDLAEQLNVSLPRKLATYVGRGGARLLHISTDAVFDGQRGDYTEEDAANPLSVYARTKLAGERAVLEASPEALVARVNMYGWSLSGKRSLAEWFFNNLAAGKPMLGFTDVYFCPLLVNDLAHILLDLLARNLSGLYHVVSPQPVDKYHFGVALARQFGLNENLISPAPVSEGGLKAARSPKLTLRCDKLVHEAGIVPPTWADGMPRFFDLYRRGYPQDLQGMATYMKTGG